MWLHWWLNTSKDDVNVVAAPATHVAFKNCAPSTKCIIKIDGTTIDDAQDLALVMSMYNLLEYSSNYFDMTGSLWFHSKDKATNFTANIANVTFKSFKYKTKLIGISDANEILENATMTLLSK